ncbi:hypothetical protein EYF80_050172 [Liparis tanakae]|uniref:Uncharacterized protein n=1 Tax=Liparis tanakae TaxID=230148 RepID=A0A4Z2FES9_9TELE|nr:hypothetical protein EYF80_050172 [Liparis tanakae]
MGAGPISFDVPSLSNYSFKDGRFPTGAAQKGRAAGEEKVNTGGSQTDSQLSDVNGRLRLAGRVRVEARSVVQDWTQRGGGGGGGEHESAVFLKTAAGLVYHGSAAGRGA